MVVHYAHDRRPSALPFLSIEAGAASKSFSAHTVCQPSQEETKGSVAHPDNVFHVPELLREFVLLDVRRKQECREVMQGGMVGLLETG